MTQHTTPTLYIANDHAAVAFKQPLMKAAEAAGYTVKNLGTDSEDSVDYPDFANAVAEAIARDPEAMGLLMCGTGIGISIAANRHAQLRAALCHSEETAALSREHNNANVLVLGARVLDEETALRILQRFLSTEFAGGRHAKRVAKLS